MSIAFVEATATATGTTSLVVTPLGGSTDQSINYLSVACKPYDTALVTPSGWTLIQDGTNGSVATGADVGSVHIATYYKIGDIGVTAVTITTTGTAANSMIGSISTYSKATSEVWDFELFTLGSDSTVGANIAAVGVADLELVAGDLVYVAFAGNSDAGTASAQTISATGATFAAYSSHNNTASASGDDMVFVSGDFVVSTGPSSAAPTFSYTNASSSSGVASLLRIRAVTLTIAVAYNTDSDINPAIEITVTGLPSYATYQITRLCTSGDYALAGVRGYDTVEAVSSTAVAVDYEAPLNRDLMYTVNLYVGTVLYATLDASDTINLLSDVGDGAPLEYFHLAFLKSVSQPALNKRIALKEFDTWHTPGRVLANVNVLGRKNPVVLTDVLGGRTGSFKFFTWDPSVLVGTTMELDWGATYAAIRDLLAEGDVLLFQTTSEFVGQDFYLKVADVQVQRINKPPTFVGTTLEHTPLLVWEIEWIEVDAPSTTGVEATFATWQAVLDDALNLTWADVRDRFATWLDVLQYYS